MSTARDGAECLSPKWQVRLMASSDSPALTPRQGAANYLKTCLA